MRGAHLFLEQRREERLWRLHSHVGPSVGKWGLIGPGIPCPALAECPSIGWRVPLIWVMSPECSVVSSGPPGLESGRLEGCFCARLVAVAMAGAQGAAETHEAE